MPSPDAVNCSGRHLLSELDWGAAPGDLPGGGLRPDWLVPPMSLLLGLSGLDLSCNSSDSACPIELRWNSRWNPRFPPRFCFYTRAAPLPLF